MPDHPGQESLEPVMDAGTPTPPAAAPTRGGTWKRVIQAVVSLAIVVGIFWGIMPLIADYSDVWATIRAMTWREILSLVAVGIWNVATYWFVISAAFPGLPIRNAAVVNQASTAVSNTLPGGGAIGVGVSVSMLTSWGFTMASITRSTLVTGIWNNFVKLGMPVLALALLALEGGVTPARLTAAVVGIVVLVGAILAFGLILKSDRLARIVGRGLGRVVARFQRLLRREPSGDWDERAARFRLDTIGLLRHRWLWLTITALVSHLALYFVLLMALRHVGVSQGEVSWITVLAAFAFVRLISALPITPGGVGVVELGYAAVLTIGLDPLTKAQVVAAILVFRAITYLLPIPLGIVAYGWWRWNKSWRMSHEERAELAGNVYEVGQVEAS